MTRELLNLLSEHKDAAKEVISECMMGANSVQDVDLFKIAQYKGQIHALEEVIDLEDFLREKLEVKNADQA